MNPQDMQAIHAAMAARQQEQAQQAPPPPQVTSGMGYHPDQAQDSQAQPKSDDKEMVILKTLISRLNKYPVPGEQASPQAPQQAQPASA